MDTKDTALIEKLRKEDPEFDRLYREHQDYERQLEELQEQHPQSSSLHFEIEKVKKLKLAGKDLMETILSRHR